MSFILGLDPGSRVAGFGIIRANGDELVHVNHGVFRLPDVDFPARLLTLGSGLRELFKKFPIKEVAVERVFQGKNADSAFKLGQARGVCLYEAACSGARISEYSPREIKKGVTGSGAAGKDQVRFMVLTELQISTEEPEDATDALAMAIHHARQVLVEMRLQRGLER